MAYKYVVYLASNNIFSTGNETPLKLNVELQNDML
jgi:hypothetical protein